MNKKIILFSRDPGGANTIIPLVKPLEKKGYVVELFGKDAALEKYANAQVQSVDITKSIHEISKDSILDFLKRKKPDFIITGTSGNDCTEKYLWAASNKLKVPSFAIVDQWMNYGIRFSKYQIMDIGKYNEHKKHDFLPTKILIMDEYAKKEAINEGLEPSMLIVTGQPHFEALREYKSENVTSGPERINRKYNIAESAYLITFASEPISKDYGINEAYMGYNEQAIFKILANNLKKIALDFDRKITLIIKLHPREQENSYRDILDLSDEKIDIHIDKNSNPLDLILSSNLICGMSSMFLIESVILGKPVISVQIGLNNKNPFILNRRGIIKSILDEDSLFMELKSTILKNEIPQYNFKIIENPINNVIYQMENILCQF
jgi:hypothetical protein